MVTEADIDEARRRALRTGEEDPVVEAQRYLNIYRQMHIFPKERKESFNKMLLGLSPQTKTILGSLPGGALLQDYIDELSEKAGQPKINKTETPSKTSDANQQAQILATAISKAQAAQATNMAPVNLGAAKISMDKDFAGEFARIISNVVEQQTAIQRETLEKISLDFNKVQMLITQNIQENKEQQHNEIMELCKAIVQSQTSLQSSVYATDSEHAPVQIVRSSETDETIAKVLESIVSCQQQMSEQLSKSNFSTSDNSSENSKLIEAFEKSQTELIKAFSAVSANLPTVTSERDDSKLVELINRSQENLLKTFIESQQPNIGSAQQNNNANNIQINSDNSSQTLLLIEKIASLQASNEKNLEKAITKVIKEQGELFDKMSRRQTKELVEIIAKAIKDAAISSPQYAYTSPYTKEDLDTVVEIQQHPQDLPPQSDQDEFVSEIGGNSYIYRGDPYTQEKMVDSSPIIETSSTAPLGQQPQIYDEDDEYSDDYTDPYPQDLSPQSDQDEFVSGIGGNSYIYRGDLYTQEKMVDCSPIIETSSTAPLGQQPQIYDEDDEYSDDYIDPYQNSILKD